MDQLAPWLQLAGSALEIIGVVLMANSLLSGLKGAGFLRTLVNALWRGPSARGAVRMSELSDENAVSALQGLTFVLVGFVVQGAGTALGMLFAGN
jgi:hypothetical protein